MEEKSGFKLFLKRLFIKMESAFIPTETTLTFCSSEDGISAFRAPGNEARQWFDSSLERAVR